MSNNTKKLEAIKRANIFFKESLERCLMCPRKCAVNRIKGETGYCRAGAKAMVYSCTPHHGEEPPLSGNRGSGTIFFSHCNMKCAYCQNYYFSQLDAGKEVAVEDLANMMLSLQDRGCHNINLVSPTHFVCQILQALEKAFEKGLNIPIVYNTGGYELVETITALDGIIDIYLPDMRYADKAAAKQYSDAPDYVERNRQAVMEMKRQAGDLEIGGDGIAVKGLMIRLLVLPKGISGTKETLQFIKENIGIHTFLSIMSQYYPTFKAYDFGKIARPISAEEYKNVVDCAKLLGLNNGWVQEGPSQSDSGFFGTNIKPT